MTAPQCVVCGTMKGPWIYYVNDEDVCKACLPAMRRANPTWWYLLQKNARYPTKPTL